MTRRRINLEHYTVRRIDTRRPDGRACHLAPTPEFQAMINARIEQLAVEVEARERAENQHTLQAVLTVRANAICRVRCTECGVLFDAIDHSEYPGKSPPQPSATMCSWKCRKARWNRARIERRARLWL